jgi:hypothetical protein
MRSCCTGREEEKENSEGDASVGITAVIGCITECKRKGKENK